MPKILINNRKNQQLVLLLNEVEHPRGFAIVMHGLGDSKDSTHIQMFAKCFSDNNYSVLSFDTTNSFGESDGNFEEATITTYYQDLEDVIAWFKKQKFYQAPFVLCGHSLGAICSAYFAEINPKMVKALAPISSVINIECSRETYTPEELADWEKSGYLVEDWPNGEVRLKWAYLKEKEKYDLLKKADKLKMPVLMIVGELDHSTLPAHQRLLFNLLPGKKELHVIADAPHTFSDKKHLDEIAKIMNSWIKTI